ncbi:hypothetical protein JANAI62_29360 [Jannaschia pagri]|uniref:Uncharacterized protein n=1 Tax=Jannaschia pagri TaxID=2829797 RepID=A0ABQ4NPH7_9RHOB|nr:MULTISPECIES: hypothetical protein [unclassified Jannaschia]GIT92478.1 hypothetical protein JANAI61_29360 [Jannaschia sp. AI_61]GIT96313.1 hypothetical protein JANAI62_29360 [Jannaschia sp. AI_62]
MRIGIGIVAVMIALAHVPTAQALDGAAPLTLADAPDAVGDMVLTADAVKLGQLVGIREQADGSFLCIVQLDRDLRVATSALLVAGLLRASDGSLRVPEDAASLASTMKLPFAEP